MITQQQFREVEFTWDIRDLSIRAQRTLFNLAGSYGEPDPVFKATPLFMASLKAKHLKRISNCGAGTAAEIMHWRDRELNKHDLEEVVDTHLNSARLDRIEELLKIIAHEFRLIRERK